MMPPAKRDCGTCSNVSTASGKQCATMSRRLKELVDDAGKPFTPAFVIPALDLIAKDCHRYKNVKED